ncbi:hypothetical protein GQX74_014215 [Glossina fuscipes]|nr:hypothetical protein GQX74_014215 [Glossina fuscipes]
MTQRKFFQSSQCQAREIDGGSSMVLLDRHYFLLSELHSALNCLNSRKLGSTPPSLLAKNPIRVTTSTHFYLNAFVDAVAANAALALAACVAIMANDDHNDYDDDDDNGNVRGVADIPFKMSIDENAFQHLTARHQCINNAETQYIRTIDNLIASRISLKLQLQGIHFSSANPSIYGQHNVYTAHGMNSVHNHGGSGGGLLLRCTATIGELYQEYKEIELGTPQKDPIPARDS